MTTRTRWPAVTAVIALIAFVLLDIALVGSARQAHAQDDEVVDADMTLASVEAVLSGEENDVVEAVLEIDSGPQARSDLRVPGDLSHRQHQRGLPARPALSSVRPTRRRS